MLKICKECKQEKETTEFYKSPAYKDKLQSKCKECIRRYDQELISKKVNTIPPHSKKCCRCNIIKEYTEFHKRPRNSDGLRSECKVCTREQEKDCRTKNPHQGYFARILLKYGMTPEEHAILIAKHDGKCAICGDDKKLVIDHSHHTGKVRGLLCTNCNAGLGMFGDKIGLLEKAIQYLGDENVHPAPCA